MKKVLLFAIILAVLLCACAGNPASVAQNESTSTQSATAPENQSSNESEPESQADNEVPPTQETQNEAVNVENNNEEEESNPTAGSNDQTTETIKWQDVFTGRSVIEETVLVDEANIKITATELEYNSYQATVSLSIENNTDKDLSFTSNTWGDSCNSINGYMMSAGWINEDVAAGKKAKADASFSLSELAVYGITDIAEIQLGFRIMDDDYDEYLVTGPRSIRTSSYAAYDLTKDTYKDNIQEYITFISSNVQIDGFLPDVIDYSNGIRLLSILFVVNGDGEQMIMIELENTTNEDRTVSISDMMLNDLMVYSGTWTSDRINANSRCVTGINLNSCLEDYYWDMLPLNQYSKFSCELGIIDLDANTLSTETITASNTRPETSLAVDGLEVINNETCRMIFVGIGEEHYSYMPNDYHVVLLVENKADYSVSYRVEWNSISINDYMVDNWMETIVLSSLKTGLLDLTLNSDDLEDIAVESISDIENIEFSFSAKDDSYNTIFEESVQFDYTP